MHHHIPEGVILHTDLGSQYTGIESFHASLKKGDVYTTNYLDFEEINRTLFSYIGGFYNRNRIS